LENLFQGRTPNPLFNAPNSNDFNKPQIHNEDMCQSMILDHLTLERANMPQKKNKKSKTVASHKRLSKEW
jgi:hypothetical protein